VPGREIVLANNEVYHIFNRSIASQPIFLNKRDYQRALETFFYYQNSLLPTRYSKFITQAAEIKQKILTELKDEKSFLVEIIAFCFMPTHFHFLLKQVKDNGISKFVGNFSNSYTRYFNTKNKRNGPLLQGKFKAVHITTNEQLVHVSRYIHLNPYTSLIIKKVEDLMNYPFSSFPEYLGKSRQSFCQKELVLSHFKKTNTYKDFVFNQADYQRTLDQIKHLVCES